MKKRIFALLLTVILAAGSLSACGEGTQTGIASADAGSASQGEAVSADSISSQISVSSAAVTESSSVEADSPEIQTGEQTEEQSGTEESSEISSASSISSETGSGEDISEEEISENTILEEAVSENVVSEEELTFLAMDIPEEFTGDLIPDEEIGEAQELTQDEQNELDRAMRAYTPSSDTLLKNDAKKFYYYSKMTKDQKAMYDAMMMVCEDPANEQNIVKAVISNDPHSNGFADDFRVAYYGMLYDHAELFWLYNQIECGMRYSIPYINNAPSGKYEVYFRLDQPYANYETEMKAFNKAVKKFLKKIDTTKSKANIVKQVHNRLVNLAEYNTPVLEDDTEWSHRNLAHTAYGALVEDSSGNSNYAVCDGYSQAFVYLLQQCGITATVIVGVAGGDQSSAGGHAWTVVKLGKDWYEIDSTWDDPGMLAKKLERIKKNNPANYKYFKEAYDSNKYRKKCQYYLYNITTKKMTSYEPDDYYRYYAKDGSWSLSLIGKSVHIRASNKVKGYECYAGLMKLAPVAKGTKYAVH